MGNYSYVKLTVLDSDVERFEQIVQDYGEMSCDSQNSVIYHFSDVNNGDLGFEDQLITEGITFSKQVENDDESLPWEVNYYYVPGKGMIFNEFESHKHGTCDASEAILLLDFGGPAVAREYMCDQLAEYARVDFLEQKRSRPLRALPGHYQPLKLLRS